MGLRLRLALLLVAAPAVAWAQGAPDGLALSLNCSTCHGIDGQSPGAVASLKGMPAEQIVAAFRQFRTGERPASIMNRIAKGFSEAEAAAIAEYWSRLK